MPFWLLDETTYDLINAAVIAGKTPTTEQQLAFEAEFSAANADGPRVLNTQGDTASIVIQGVLTGAPSFMARYYGGGNTTYGEIRNAIASAEADPRVQNVSYHIASPGGEASSEWLATMEAMAAGKKPSQAIVGTVAASAAYGLASQADTIVAQNAMSVVGSVGVMTQRYLDPSVVTLTSTEAPNKRPDLNTPEGKAVITAELDALHEIFASNVASGRGITVADVNKKFGRGGTVLAAEAVKRGMIDGLLADNSKSTNAATSGTQRVLAMDKDKLKAEHPAVYAAIVAEGVNTERERVSAHVNMGEATGAPEIALANIKGGKEFGPLVLSEYMAVAVNRNDSKSRVTEDAAAAAALAAAGKKPNTTEAEAEDAVYALVAEALGHSEA